MKEESYVRKIAAPVILALSATLAACGGSSSGDSGNLQIAEDTKYVAAIATSSSDSGEVELAELGKSKITASGGYFSDDISDITVNAYGANYYLIGKFTHDWVKKVDPRHPAIATWDYPTMAQGVTGSSNPYQLVFASEEKAYLIRYGANTAWIVNPSATTESEFYIDELDLSAYIPDDSIGVPNMSSGVIVGDRLFITMQRLDSGWQPTNTAYVAVFDTNTDNEINTHPTIPGTINGIPLKGSNPVRIDHVKGLGLVVVNVGGFSAPFDGTSVDTIKLETYAVGSIIADEEIDTQINNAVFVSPTQAYILNYAGWKDISLQRFNPSVGATSLKTVANLTGEEFKSIDVSPEGTLWVGDRNESAPGIRIFDTTTDQQIDFIATDLSPISVAFIETDTKIEVTP